MHATETAYFIKDRALSLTYEAIQFPATSGVALAWLHRAMAKAQKFGMKDLADDIGFAVMCITDHYDACEHFALDLPAGSMEESFYVPA